MQEWHVYNVLTWLLEPDSGTEIGVQKVYWACPRDQHLSGSKGSETGSREELNGFPGRSDGQGSTCNGGDLGSIPGLGRSPGEGNGYPLQCSGLENSMDCTVHRVAKSQTWLSDFHFYFHVTAEALADPPGSSGAGTVLRFPALCQEELALPPSAAAATGQGTWVRQRCPRAPWPEDHSWRGTPPRAVSRQNQQCPELGDRVPHPESASEQHISASSAHGGQAGLPSFLTSHCTHHSLKRFRCGLRTFADTVLRINVINQLGLACEKEAAAPFGPSIYRRHSVMV